MAEPWIAGADADDNALPWSPPPPPWCIPLMLLPAVQFILARPWPGNLAQKARANGRTLLISDIMQVLVQVEQVLVLVEQILVHVVLVLLLLVQQAPLIGDIMQPLLKHRTMSAKGQKLMRYNDPAYPTSKLSKSTPDPAPKAPIS